MTEEPKYPKLIVLKTDELGLDIAELSDAALEIACEGKIQELRTQYDFLLTADLELVTDRRNGCVCVGVPLTDDEYTEIRDDIQTSELVSGICGDLRQRQ